MLWRSAYLTFRADSNYSLTINHLNSVVVMEVANVYALTHKKAITHFIEISSIGNVIHGHGGSTETQERLGEHFLIRNLIRIS